MFRSVEIAYQHEKGQYVSRSTSWQQIWVNYFEM